MNSQSSTHRQTRETDEIFGRTNDDGNVMLLYVDDGADVTQLDEGIYPVGSQLSARYDHPEGIVVTPQDAAKLGVVIEA